jgi:hypothetical protein
MPREESIKELSWGVDEKMARITERRQDHVKSDGIEPGTSCRWSSERTGNTKHAIRP